MKLEAKIYIALAAALAPVIALAPPNGDCLTLEEECNDDDCGGNGVIVCPKRVDDIDGLKILDFTLITKICDFYPNTIPWSGDDCDNPPPGWDTITGCENEFGEDNCCIGESSELILMQTPHTIIDPEWSRPCIQIASN